MSFNSSSNRKNGCKSAHLGTASNPAISAEEYKVGPGHPPKEHQFRPGSSGNPKGRKRNPASLAPDLKRIFQEALSQKVTVKLKQGDKEQTLTLAEAGIKQVVLQFANGDRHARRDVFHYAEKLGIDLLAGHQHAIEEALAPDHQAILDAYVARRTQATVPCRSSRVVAPPELLDDDTKDPK